MISAHLARSVGLAAIGAMWAGVAVAQGSAGIEVELEELRPLIDSWKAREVLASGSKMRSALREQEWRSAAGDGHAFDKLIVTLRSYSLVTHLPVTGHPGTAVKDLQELKSDVESECARQGGHVQDADPVATEASSHPMVSKAIPLLLQQKLLGRQTCRTADRILFQVNFRPNVGAQSSLMPMGWNWIVRVDLFHGQPLMELEQAAQAYRSGLKVFRDQLRSGTEIQIPATQVPASLLKETTAARAPEMVDLCALVTDIKPGVATVQFNTVSLVVPVAHIFPGGEKTSSKQSRRPPFFPRQANCMKLE